jgi:hypothetical protein
MAEFMLGKSSLLGDMGDYDDYSSLIEPLREKEATWMVIANKSKVEKVYCRELDMLLIGVCGCGKPSTYTGSLPCVR